MKKKDVWIVSEYYYPIVTSTGYYLTEIAEYLAKNENLSINVICTGVSYNEITSYNVEKQEKRNDVMIHRVLMKTIDKNHFVKRLFRMAWSAIRLLVKVLQKTNKGDYILFVTNPAFLVLALPLIKGIKKSKCILLVHDVFPENLVAIKKLNENSFLYRCAKKVFDWSYSKADTCISIGRDMTNVLEKKTNKKNPICLIPNWADIDLVYPVQKENTDLFNKLKLKNKIVIQFAGNLGHAQGLDNILNAISLVKNDRLHFLFVGGGAKYDMIQSYAQNNAMNNISLVGFQERSAQNDFLNACDIAMVTLNDGMLGLGVPSKSYNIMAAGKPMIVIADPKSEISLCTSEYEIGWCVLPNDPNALNKVFNELVDQQDQFKHMGEKARWVAENIFAKDKVLKKYDRLFGCNS